MTDAHALASPWQEAMDEALALAAQGPRGVNPQVGCVIVSDDGAVIARGYHRGAGTAHAEVDALAQAGAAARGATAVVTLEPCRHTGRTGPCTSALIDAGITRVVYAVDDPTAPAAGGAQVLRDAGLEVIDGVRRAQGEHLLRGWLSVQRAGRPHVTLKCAMSLDGRVADASGGPTALTGAQARAHAHAVRAEVDAIVVGTGTALIDDPSLTARRPDGSLFPHQPLRVVVGTRTLPATARVLDDAAPTLLVTDHDPAVLVASLLARGVQTVVVEGGPTLAAAMLEADLIDAVAWYVAPVVLGAGPLALPTLGGHRELNVTAVSILGTDVLIEGTLMARGSRPQR